MLRAGDRVGVAVSGGADSVALLLLLVDLQESLGIQLSVLHLNHELRGSQSDQDETFVQELSSALGLEFHSARADVAAQARQQGRNLEEVARALRYEFFNAAVDAGRATRVAVAHSADDQAETVLAHLIRGTGPTGLGAIFPVAGIVVRPLLGLRRAELRDYIRKRKQPWREDRSNLDMTRMRARIRRKLLPLIEKDFQRAIVSNLSRLSNLAREDDTFWKVLVDDCYQSMVKKEGTRFIIAVQDLLVPLRIGPRCSGAMESSAVTALAKRLVRRIISEIKTAECTDSESRNKRKQVTAGHIARVMQLAKAGISGHVLDLPGGIAVEREFDRMIFFCDARASNHPGHAAIPDGHKYYEYKVTLDAHGSAAVRVAEIGSIFHLKVIDWPSLTSETRLLVAALDQALLRPPLLLRNWRPGDSFRPHGRKRARKLKRLLLEKRVGLRDRAGWPVLTSAGTLVWARGLPVSAGFAPRHETRAILVIAEEAL
ncbi:MAG TPA: tRNA lysidine(34) synthetase TilS [Candidatus Dormibacteraeota bacterium]|nr:tRNA lysidine(34) synthetase TilS [Candidatus Dormibacteraeota bacterium]